MLYSAFVLAYGVNFSQHVSLVYNAFSPRLLSRTGRRSQMWLFRAQFKLEITVHDKRKNTIFKTDLCNFVKYRKLELIVWNKFMWVHHKMAIL